MHVIFILAFKHKLFYEDFAPQFSSQLLFFTMNYLHLLLLNLLLNLHT